MLIKRLPHITCIQSSFNILVTSPVSVNHIICSFLIHLINDNDCHVVVSLTWQMLLWQRECSEIWISAKFCNNTDICMGGIFPFDWIFFVLTVKWKQLFVFYLSESERCWLVWQFMKSLTRRIHVVLLIKYSWMPRLPNQWSVVKTTVILRGSLVCSFEVILV